MKPIKKFSTISDETSRIMESLKEAHGPALLDIVKKLGYNSLEEISKQKSILTKLESLLKEIPGAKEVSEDEADDIEDEVVKRGTPKDASDKAGEKEEDKEPGASNTVVEDEADDIEDKVLKRGEPKSLEDKEGEEEEDGEVGGSNTEVAEEEEEVKSEEKETPKATRKIMTFEDFVSNEDKSKSNKDKSKNENAIVEDEEVGASGLAIPLETGDGSKSSEEIEDEIVKLGEPEKHNDGEGETLVTKDQNVTATVTGAGSIIKSFAAFIKEAEEVGASGLAIPLETGDGSKTAEEIEDEKMKMGKVDKLKDAEGKVFVTKDQNLTEDPKTSKDKPANVVVEGKVNEGDKVSSDAEFKEYATAVLKKAFGDKFDEDEANKVIDGLTKKYEGNYGAMVGALQSSLDEDFINEGKSWWDFNAEKIAKDFMRDYKDKTVNSEGLNNWFNDFANDKKIEKGLPGDIAEEVVDILTKHGYKHLKANELRTESVVNEATAVLDCLMVEIEADYETSSGRSAHKDFKVLVKCNDESQAKHIHDIIAHTDNIDTNEIADDVLNQMIDSSTLVGCTLSKSKSFKNEYSVEDFLSALEDSNKDLVKKLRK